MIDAAHVRALRRAYWAHGFRPVAIWNPGAENDKGKPIPGAGKRPVGLDWREKALRDPPAAITAAVSSRALNTGIVCDERVIAIDVDVPVQEIADQLVHHIERKLSPSPLSRIGRAPKILLAYRPETPVKKMVTPELFLPDGTKVQLEILGIGQQFVADGTHPDTGQPYVWTDGSPAEVAIGELPVVSEAMLRELIAEAEAMFRAAGAVEKEDEEKPQPKTSQRRHTNGSDFFRNVNNAALNDIAAWVERLFPRARYQPRTGAYRVASADLGRNLEEDLSIHPSGIEDFGTRKKLTAIDLVIDWGDEPDPVEAAKWLCGRLGVTPQSLGWRNGHDHDENPKARLCPPASLREATFNRRNEWSNGLLLTDKEKIRACLANAITALRTAPEWEDHIWLDAFHNRAVLRGKPPWSKKNFDDEPWSDLFDNLVTDWMHHQGIMVSRDIVGHAVWTVAHDQWFHPVRQYLERCRGAWDKQKRVETWTTTYLGTPDTAYSRAAGLRWLVSLVARIMEPGCKADCSLVLEGPQGMLKSEALRRLGYPWVTDDMGGSDPGSKDAAIQVAGVWIVELAELDQFTNGRDVARTKSFMSRSTDRFRPPYGRHALPQPRQCGFACTTNKSEYLPDETGNRRWWPIVCTRINLTQLVDDKDQLLGEAVALYEANSPWWLDTIELNALATAEQDKRYVPDAWDPVISHYLNHPSDEVDDGNGRKRTITGPPLDNVTVGEILEKAIGLLPAYWKQPEQNRVARSLQSLKWKRKQQRTGQDREWRYFRPKTDDE
jgi:predicted P-loop ATPase